MRNRKDTIDHVQNFVLLLLSLSALILLFRLPLLSDFNFQILATCQKLICIFRYRIQPETLPGFTDLGD